MMETMAVGARERVWIRRLAVGVVLVTCAGGGASVLVSRPHGDCVAVGDMMRTYSAFQATNANTEERAQAEAATADTLHEMARGIERTELSVAANAFADAVASSAQAQLDATQQMPSLDPFDAVLPAVDPAELQAGEAFTASAHILLVACPSTPHPVGLD
jgi:hypothetical protein